MWNRSAKRGAILCQETWVRGLPCNSNKGGPSPPCLRWIRAPLVAISLRVNPSNMLPPFRQPTAHTKPIRLFFARAVQAKLASSRRGGRVGRAPVRCRVDQAVALRRRRVCDPMVEVLDPFEFARLSLWHRDGSGAAACARRGGRNRDPRL